MPFEGIRSMHRTHPLKNEMAACLSAKRWRQRERGKILGERDALGALFNGLDEIDNMIAGEKQKNKRKKHGPKLPDTPPSTPKKGTINQFALPTRSPLQQRIQGDRMCKGRRSEGEALMIDVVEEVRWLTKMPQSKYSPSLSPSPRMPQSKYSPSLSPRLNALPGIVSSPEKRRNSKDSEASTRSAASEASNTTESLCSMPDGTFDSSRPSSVRSTPRTGLPSPPGSAQSTSTRSTSSWIHTFEKVPSDESSSNNGSPLPPSTRSTSPVSTRPTLKPPPLLGVGDSKDSTTLVPSAPPSVCSLKFRPQFRARRASEGDCRPRSMGQRREEARVNNSAPVSPRKAEGQTRSPFSTSGIIERVVQGKAISLERREACESIRLFLFGSVGHVGIEAHHLSNYWKKAVFSDGEGTAEQCSLLYDFWSRLDPGLTWVANIDQLQLYLHQVPLKKRALGLKFVSFLVSREKSRFSVEDAMRIIWPCSSGLQLANMKALMAGEDEENRRKKAKTAPPPMLPEDDHEALTRIFKQLDTNQTGMVSFQALEDARDELDLPLVDSDTVRRYTAIWDPEGSGYFGLETFLQMMCPAGFQAFAQSKVAVSPDGDRICRSLSGAWYISESNSPE